MRVLDLLTGEGGRLSMSPNAAPAPTLILRMKRRANESGHEFAGRLNQAEGEADRADRPLRLRMTAHGAIFP
jgi:hypothetical protein